MFAKLTSTKLSWHRVSQQARPGLYPSSAPLVAPAHANDNRVMRHDRGGALGRPVLTCRWVPAAGGGLECRWALADGETAWPGEVAASRRRLALVAGRAHRAP
jgi:hypothetical protein